jgi:hypothetical protein
MNSPGVSFESLIGGDSCGAEHVEQAKSIFSSILLSLDKGDVSHRRPNRGYCGTSLSEPKRPDRAIGSHLDSKLCETTPKKFGARDFQWQTPLCTKDLLKPEWRVSVSFIGDVYRASGNSCTIFTCQAWGLSYLS